MSLSGVADAELLTMLLETVRQIAVEDGPVVVDLTDVTLVAPDALRSTLVGLAEVPTLRVVTQRDTARVILLRCGLAPGMLFASVDDALRGVDSGCAVVEGGRRRDTAGGNTIGGHDDHRRGEPRGQGA